MILSTSSSRAVSIRIGTSELLRIRLHSSTPSPSGRLRSRTMSAGTSDATSVSAAWDVAAVRTAYPAFLRYAATNDAIDVSSSTTRMPSCVTWCPSPVDRSRPGSAIELQANRIVGHRHAALRLGAAVGVRRASRRPCRRPARAARRRVGRSLDRPTTAQARSRESRFGSSRRAFGSAIPNPGPGPSSGRACVGQRDDPVTIGTYGSLSERSTTTMDPLESVPSVDPRTSSVKTPLPPRRRASRSPVRHRGQTRRGAAETAARHAKRTAFRIATHAVSSPGVCRQ